MQPIHWQSQVSAFVLFKLDATLFYSTNQNKRQRSIEKVLTFFFSFFNIYYFLKNKGSFLSLHSIYTEQKQNTGKFFWIFCISFFKFINELFIWTFPIFSCQNVSEPKTAYRRWILSMV